MRSGYLIADVEASTQRWERGASAMRAAMAKTSALIDAAVSAHGGRIHDRAGDGVFVVFENRDALACALDIQFAMQVENFDEVGGLALRVGVHAGPLEKGGAPNPVFANRVARIAACGWGGQIVLSGEARDAFSLPTGARLQDLGFVRLRGIFSPIRLYGLHHHQLARTEFPAPRAGVLRASSLPPAMGPLIGRERELAEIVDALTRRQLRHLTVIGAGGAGKTRLVVEAARILGEGQAVVYSPLDASVETESLEGALCRALDLPAHIGATRRQLIEFLHDKQALIVLDNVESIATSDRLSDHLLDACPRITILAAGRAPMRNANEVLYPLSGLAWGNGAVATSGAYQFFAHEENRNGAPLSLDEGSAAVFSAICDKVSGSPLALQLAARWRRVLSLQEILSRLEDGVDFLSGAAEPHDRHGGLRAVFATSWSLLTPQSQLLLARLSVFRGAFDLTDAEAVTQCRPSEIADLEVRGLVERIEAERFRLHPLVAEYAREQLSADALEERQCALRHCVFFLDLVTTPLDGRAEAFGGGSYADLRAAWAFAVSHEIAIAWRSAEALFYGLVARSKFREALDLFSTKTSDEALGALCSAMRANALVHLGARDQARPLAGEVLADEVLDVARTPLARAHACHALGNIEHIEGNYALAQAHYEEARDLRIAAADRPGLIYSYLSLAALEIVRVDVGRAREQLDRAFMVFADAGMSELAPLLHVIAADFALLEGRTNDAHALISEAMVGEQIAPQHLTRALIRLAKVLSRGKDYDGARARLIEAVDVAEASGDLRGRLLALIEYARADIEIGDFVEAKARLLRVCRETLNFGAAPLLRATLEALIEAERGAGNEGQAQRLYGVLEEAYVEDATRARGIKRALEEVMLADEYERLSL